ncbi:hypothetical protein L2750_16860 [Shewanella submarina]|uniref:Uncharacterized protein n=1 Tax=Shewanella submarina TaxID=2016376 RepID=A0ABV7GGB9_9GAMM|nr:hypothetical protein [Shewanella submarina]MCL1038802.1 hypothetical protein [Shewanella submarina]
MNNWFEIDGGLKLSLFSAQESGAARQAAAVCTFFEPDDEDEWVDDIQISCFNCQYRRWLQHKISCHRP